MEHVPVLRPADRVPVLVLLVEPLDFEAAEQRLDVVSRVKRHVRCARPRVARAEEVGCEDAPRTNGAGATPPGLGEVARVAKRETQTRVDEIRLRKLGLLERRDERRQPSSSCSGNRGAETRDARGGRVHGDQGPALRQERQRLGAVAAAEIDRDSRPVRELERVEEELPWRAALDRSVIVLPRNPGHLGTLDTLPVYERRWWADHSTNRS
jgi:hypothetical protein